MRNIIVAQSRRPIELLCRLLGCGCRRARYEPVAKRWLSGANRKPIPQHPGAIDRDALSRDIRSRGAGRALPCPDKAFDDSKEELAVAQAWASTKSAAIYFKEISRFPMLKPRNG